MKYNKTNYPNILTYETRTGTKYRIRKSYKLNGNRDIIDESGFKTLAHAKARLREIETELDKNEFGYLFNKNTTVSEYYKIYSSKKIKSKKWSKDSQCSNDSLFNNHIIPEFGNTPLQKLNRGQYQIFISEKLESLRRESVKSIHNLFMGLLNDAELEGVLIRNRLKRVDIPQSEIPSKNKKITLDQFKEWMEMAQKILTKYEMAVVQLCSYGLRRGEVCGLSKGAVTFENHTSNATIKIFNTRTARVPEGKNSAKTKTSERLIVLDKKGTTAVKTLINEASDIMQDHGRILHNDDYLFLNQVTAKPYHPTQLNTLFERVSESCDIKVTPHILRHFFATQAAIAGVPIEHAAAYLGHKNTSMTEHYTHISDETASNVVDLVSRHIENG